MKGCKKIIYANGEEKQTGRAITTLEKKHGLKKTVKVCK